MRFAHSVPPCQCCLPQPAAQLYVSPRIPALRLVQARVPAFPYPMNRTVWSAKTKCARRLAVGKSSTFSNVHWLFLPHRPLTAGPILAHCQVELCLRATVSVCVGAGQACFFALPFLPGPFSRRSHVCGRPRRVLLAADWPLAVWSPPRAAKRRLPLCRFSGLGLRPPRLELVASTSSNLGRARVQTEYKSQGSCSASSHHVQHASFLSRQIRPQVYRSGRGCGFGEQCQPAKHVKASG